MTYPIDLEVALALRSGGNIVDASQVVVTNIPDARPTFQTTLHMYDVRQEMPPAGIDILKGMAVIGAVVSAESSSNVLACVALATTVYSVNTLTTLGVIPNPQEVVRIVAHSFGDLFE